MNKILFFLFFASCLTVSCQKEHLYDPIIEVEEGTLFYFPGSYDNLQHFPLLYNYSDGLFNDPSINYVKAQDFDLLTKSTLQVMIMDHEDNIDYIIAKEIAINYNEYGSHSDGTGVYNGLWRNVEDAYPRDFLLAVNFESEKATILFLENDGIFRKKFQTSYDEDGYLVITIESMNLGYGPEQWIIKRNFLTSNSNTGIASLHVSVEGGNGFGYLNALTIVDDKR